MIKLPARPQADEIVDGGIVVVGTGVAGLAAALSLSPRAVTLLTKSRFAEGGSSPWAQGGVAAALGADDSPALHGEDTHEAGAGLCDPEAVRILTEEGPRRVRRLISLGARFDRNAAGEPAMGREGAHQRRRILHAGGDQTGAEMVRALASAVAEDPAIQIHENVFAMDLVRQDERVVGVLCRQGNRRILFRASAVILAAGGFGQVYAKTTNPEENTGDGLAMAARAGARLADLEMVQFHPTALDVEAPGGTLPLVTEALRGEGAILTNDQGERFMPAIHPDAELAPRDVVARAIWRQGQEGHRVFLDARGVLGNTFPDRFPTVFDHCRRYGIDPRRQAIPVTPAAHYAMAGVDCDDRGRASLQGLWVCGEVSATGVHGANRLASNSLLEGLVYGHRAALDVVQSTPAPAVADELSERAYIRREVAFPAPADQAKIRDLMWRQVGLMRDSNGLKSTLQELRSMAAEKREPDSAANLWTVARMVTASALSRQESRGSHFRSDFPQPELAWRRRLFWTYRGAADQPLQRVMMTPAQERLHLVREIA